MDKKVLKKELLNEIKVQLSEMGFEKKIRGQAIWLYSDNSIFEVHLAFIDHKDDFDVIVNLSISLCVLENIKNEVNKELAENRRKETFSFGVELGNLFYGGQKRWTLKSETDIKVVAKDIADEIRTNGIKFLEKYSNLENVYEISSRDDIEAWKIMPFHAMRAKNAIGLAYLLKKEDIEELICKKEKYLLERNDFGLGQFQQFAELIRSKLR